MRAMIIVWLWISCSVCAVISLPSMDRVTAVLVSVAAVLTIYISCTKQNLLRELDRLNDKFKQNT